MPRTRRIIPEAGPVHIMCRGNNKNKILDSEFDKYSYLEFLSRYKEDNRITINHYCILDNHLHLIVWMEEDSDLSKFMKQVNLSYFHAFKKQYDYCGHLWQGRFRSSIIDTESYLLQCGKYIELNPVRAGLVDHPSQYKFSSFNYYASGQSDCIISPNPLYFDLSPSKTERMKLYTKLVVDDAVKVKLHLNFVGDSEYELKMEDHYNVHNNPRPRGRPKLL